MILKKKNPDKYSGFFFYLSLCYCFIHTVPERFRVWSVHGTKSEISALFWFGQLKAKTSHSIEITELGI